MEQKKKTLTESDGKYTWDRFEKLVLARGRSDEAAGMYCIDPMGVQVSRRYVKGQKPEHIPISSYPDFFGSFDDGRGFVFDAKTCSGASWPLNEDKLKKRQYDFMIKRAMFGEVCGILLHFNPRILKTKITDPSTWWIPVFYSHPIWKDYDSGLKRNITLGDCQMYGISVEWNLRSKGARVPTPDIGAVFSVLRRSSSKRVRNHLLSPTAR